MLTGQFPKAAFTRQADHSQHNALRIFSGDWNNLKEIKLYLKGTDFQLKVWQALLQIPFLVKYPLTAQSPEKSTRPTRQGPLALRSAAQNPGMPAMTL
jgi:O6-methylguanine-DNA--protein-cysteine methyltransferase